MELLCKNVIGEASDTHISKFFETEEAYYRFWEYVTALQLFMEHIATFVRFKTDTTIEERKYSTFFA